LIALRGVTTHHSAEFFKLLFHPFFRKKVVGAFFFFKSGENEDFTAETKFDFKKLFFAKIKLNVKCGKFSRLFLVASLRRT
jgi:hypothetical protein